MNINKTADECIIEQNIAILQFLIDKNLTLKQKQETTKWLTNFFDLQDAVNLKNKKMIINKIYNLNNFFTPWYFQEVQKEFINANQIMNHTANLKNLKNKIIKFTSKNIINKINILTNNFMEIINKYSSELPLEFKSNLKLLLFIIYYKIGHIFKEEINNLIVEPIVDVFLKKVKVEPINTNIIILIIEKNEEFLNQIQIINLINFMFQTKEILEENENNELIKEKIKNLIYLKPNKIVVTLNQLFKNEQINLYEEIWKHNKIGNSNNNLLMHLLAYETYFIQGYNHNKTYEELIIDKIIHKNLKYKEIFEKYKLINNVEVNKT